MSKLRRFFSNVMLCGGMLSFLVGCQTTPAPLEEYVMARSAVDAAREAQAVQYSAGNWHQAEEFYRLGRVAYEERDYENAKTYFIKAKAAAERAENSARLIRHKNGEVL